MDVEEEAQTDGRRYGDREEGWKDRQNLSTVRNASA
jgi:hypothetical protein